MEVNFSDIMSAILAAASERERRKDVAPVLANILEFAKTIETDLLNGDYRKKIYYRKLEITNNNGKRRHILCPDFYTLTLEHIAIAKLSPYYARLDPKVGLNCKKGCGVNAKDRKGSLAKRLKHIFYDLREYNYSLVIDQRKCYDHVTPRIFRKALVKIDAPPWLVEFAIDVAFVKETFPIGTPTSPLAHHIIMLNNDLLARSLCKHSVRYADDNFLAFFSKEEAHEAKWRIKNLWWYEYGIRSKRHTCQIRPLTEPTDFCGIVLRRIPGKTVCDHNKGYTLIRPSIAKRAIKASPLSYPSYFGMIKAVDGFGLLKKIESGNMKLQQLTAKIKINRELDAPNITPKELSDNGTEFVIHDYEIRCDKSREPNWIKCLISYRDESANGRRVVREYHGCFASLVKYHMLCEEEFTKQELLPITNVRIENACGFIYAGSTNMICEMDDEEIFNQ